MDETTVNRELVRIRRRRAMMMRFIRDGHEEQKSRMDDFEVYALLQDMGVTMSRNQVMTMLQDLETLKLVAFRTEWSEADERYLAKEIELTAMGTALVLRRKSTEDVLFD